jgi:hypothetical protein
MQRERGQIDKAVLKALNGVPGCYAEKLHTTPFGKQKLDVLACYRGRFILLEVKGPGKKPTLRQAMTMARWSRAGALVAVVHSKQEALDVIASIGLQLFSLQHENSLAIRCAT